MALKPHKNVIPTKITKKNAYVTAKRLTLKRVRDMTRTYS